jgi:hypothetical protein
VKTEYQINPEQAGKIAADGYLQRKGIIPEPMVQAAQREISQRTGRLRAAAGRTTQPDDLDALNQALKMTYRADKDDANSAIMDLINRSPLTDLLNSALGSLFPIDSAQIATLYPAEDACRTNEAGYLNIDTPHNGWCPHLDGLWNGGTSVPAVGKPLAASRLKDWYTDTGTNGARLAYPEHNTCIANFTALVGVALSDQRAIGSGNLGLLRGGHRHMEKFFQSQMEQGGPLGPDGPGWPRENSNAPNGHGLVHYPERVRKRYARGAVHGKDGSVWPKPTWMKLKAGDAILVHFSTPHSGSRVLGGLPRTMVYFRCVAGSRPEENIKVYPQALCDNWLEWPGVRRFLSS